MTIGPEPMMQTASMSSLRGSAHLLDPGLDERPCVVRAGPCLRVELQRPGSELRIGEPFDGAVVERRVRGGAVARLAHGEAVVLARDEHESRRTLQHRMVRSTVAERELVRLVSRREREQLVAE